MTEKVINKLKFKGSWRNYQRDVLQELTKYFEDEKLHVVAAPGAGKTILGIEVCRQLANNTLILSPTIVIKNQWKARIVENFLPHDVSPDVISTELFDVKEITSGTYQRLHAIYKKHLDEEFITKLKEQNIKTLVLDEAHHLRSEWYNTLNDFIKRLKTEDFKIVSLTATPPYDVEEKEWNNYYNLCGPIDTEISVPELVKNKDLCPHQDLIYFSSLDKKELKEVKKFEDRRKDFFNYINKNSDFWYAVETSSFIQGFEENSDLIFEDVDFTVALISYIFSVDDLHIKAGLLLNFLKLKKENIPEFDYDIAKTLFDGVLGKFKKHFKNVLQLKAKLKECQLLKNASKVDFNGDTNFRSLYAKSSGKLNGIVDITNNEKNNLKDKLREVILLDYIGLEASNYGLNAISAFRKLTKEIQDVKVGILTGSIVVIPETSKELLYEIAKEKGYISTNILTTEYEKGYLRVESYGDTDVVAVVTEVFARGGINVLIGTHALLGEGWDSPCINSLILASTVSSFMLSNQMRGRALRIDKNNPDKTGNIWHLIAINSTNNTGYDYHTITKRFETFDGISYTSAEIENGIDRLDIDFFKPLEELNQMMITRANDRINLTNKWKKVLNSYSDKRVLTQRREKMVKTLEIDKSELDDVYVCGNRIIKQPNLLKKHLSIITSSITGKFFEPPFLLSFIIICASVLPNLKTDIWSDSISLFLFTCAYVFCTAWCGKEINKIPSINDCSMILSFLCYIWITPTFPHEIRGFCLVIGLPILIILFLILYKNSFINNKMKMIKNHISYRHFYIAIGDILLKVLTKHYFISSTSHVYGCDNTISIRFIETPYYKINLRYIKSNDKYKLDIQNLRYEEKQSFHKYYTALFHQNKGTKYVIRLKKFGDKNLFLPPALNDNKNAQEYFRQELSKVFGEVEIVDINTLSGKRELLKAKYDKFLKGKIEEKRSWN